MSGVGLKLAEWFPLFVGLALVAIVFVGATWAEGAPGRQRRHRVNQTPEEVWRELLAGRVVEIPVFAAVGAGFLALAIADKVQARDWFNTACVAAIFWMHALGTTIEVFRNVSLGWANAQHTHLARRAHELQRRAVEETAEEAAEAAS